MENDWILRLLSEKAGKREIAIKGFKGQDKELEQLISQNIGQPHINYYTSNKSKVNNRDTFSFLEYGENREKQYLVVTSHETYNEAEWKRLEKWGCKEFDDFLWLNHYPIPVMDVAGETDAFPGGYGNKAIVHSDGIKINFLGICSEVEIGYNVKWPKALTVNVGSNVCIKIGNRVRLGNSNIIVNNGGHIYIEDNCILTSARIFVNRDSELIIGKGSTVQDGRFRTGRNSRIIVGEDCMFSWATTLLAHDGHMIYDVAAEKCLNNTAGECNESIVIGNHVWIGGETVILPNTRIDSGTICGYRSLVKGRYPNNCVIAGSPARVVKKDIAWTRTNICEDLSEYWNLKEEYRRPSETDELS